MKLKLGVLDTHNNLNLKFQKFMISFSSPNNFRNLIVLLKSQFFSTTVSILKIHIKAKIRSNLMK